MHLTLFDLDGTLLPIDSDHAFGEFVVRLGWADPDEHGRQNDAFFQDYQAGRLDMDRYIDFATAAWRQRPRAEIEAASARFMAEVIGPSLRASARALVEKHRARGDRLAVVTATNDFVTRPIAHAFGIDALIATELERAPDGRPNGRIRGVPALREGKITRVAQWLAEQGASTDDFETVTFYSDSTNDLPLLERVTHPVATNPGPALARIASERGWPILKLFE
jgi:HAD superfamily hydrolase (TIGR01490 family)